MFTLYRNARTSSKYPPWNQVREDTKVEQKIYKQHKDPVEGWHLKFIITSIGNIFKLSYLVPGKANVKCLKEFENVGNPGYANPWGKDKSQRGIVCCLWQTSVELNPYPLSTGQLVVLISYCFSWHKGSERPFIMTISQNRHLKFV